MTVPHVDLLRNDWLGGVQQVVGRVRLAEGQLSYDELSGGAVPLVADMQLRLKDVPPSEQLERLHKLVNGDYLFASEVHDSADCPYETGTRLLVQDPAQSMEPAGS